MPEKIPYEFSESLVIRTPALPFPSAVIEKEIMALLNDVSFLEAIYLASPVLYNECVKWKNGAIKSEKEIQKIKLSLVKYYQRMSSRCTPFGLFSGCSVVKWKEGETKITFEKNAPTRHTRPDMHYLCALSQKLAALPAVKNRILFYPNSSIYIIGDELRYVEYKYHNSRRVHQISSVSNSEYLLEILENAANGIKTEQAAALLLKHDVTAEEANEFIDELIASQILVSELEPAVTGKEFTYQLHETLKKYAPDGDEELKNILKILEEILSLIHRLDESGNENNVIYKEIITLAKTFGVEPDEGKIFQVDLFKTPLHHTVNKTHQQEILSALTVLNKLNPVRSNENLVSFAKRFTERYEEAPMPLAEVLDTETGIGYPEGAGKDISPLTDELILPAGAESNNQSLQWNTVQQWLFEKLRKATTENSYSVRLTDEELKELNPEPSVVNWKNLPPSLAVMFRIADGEGGSAKKIIIESAGGSSAANLPGRFAHGDSAVNNLINEITAAEQRLNPEIIFSEIVHLPEGRTGNVLLHPAFREYEIPYLAKSSLSNEKQIPVSDLWVSVESNRIKLFSKKLNKEVIPRLSTAHNFSSNALPVYQFLCDLQSQHLRHGFAFHWGNLSGQFSFLPRVEYGNCILHEATWQLKKAETEEFVQAIEKENIEDIKKIIARWKLPRYFVLADSDNELLADTESLMSLQAFAKTVKNRSFFVLKEFLFDASPAIADERGNFFTNQFIAPLVKTEAVYAAAGSNTENKKNIVHRKFEPGSEWLYYKFYCGSQSAEKILAGLIEPLTRKLKQENIIQKWFYIRYNDPSFHLRVRFRLTDNKATGYIINLISETIGQSGLSKFIWSTKIDTYQREYERYGFAFMELAEELFYSDSLNKLKFIELTDGDERENIRWLWGLRMTDELLNAFEYTLTEKQALLSVMKDNFSKEFHADKPLLLQLNKKFNNNRAAIKTVMTGDADNSHNEYAGLISEAIQYNRDISMVVAKMKSLYEANKAGASYKEAVSSYIHMALNRLFPSQARLQEYILYEFLNRYYLSVIKQNTGGAKPESV